MDNQYNYYDPNKEDKNNIFDEQPQGMNGGQTGMNGQLPKEASQVSKMGEAGRIGSCIWCDRKLHLYGSECGGR